jgi:hypothetical protein
MSTSERKQAIDRVAFALGGAFVGYFLARTVCAKDKAEIHNEYAETLGELAELGEAAAASGV